MCVCVCVCGGGKEATYFRLESPVLPVELETELSWSADVEGAPVVSDFPSGLESTRRRRRGRDMRRNRGEKKSGTSNQVSSTSV